MDPNSFQHYATRLLAIGNSVSALGAFLMLTQGIPRKKVNHLILISSIACLVTLILFLLVGTRILDFFGISVGAFQITGGLILGRIGLGMLDSKSDSTSDQNDNDVKNQKQDLSDTEFYSAAVVPLAIPLTVGGATLSAVVLFADTAARTGTFFDLLAAIIVLVVVNYLIFRFSSKIMTLLGSMGMEIFIKVMGLFMLSIGIQFLAQGIGYFYLKYRDVSVAVLGW
ncbi:MarC family protein [Synechococcus sp. UW179A]|uniref:MarC family protein n=1 Tax=Synechococcus sp. UW179A TaxID=2575510 RepID=UPI0014822EE9|nr:MarC family protein [Synechococcus sp. UW179A]